MVEVRVRRESPTVVASHTKRGTRRAVMESRKAVESRKIVMESRKVKTITAEDVREKADRRAKNQREDIKGKLSRDIRTFKSSLTLIGSPTSLPQRCQSPTLNDVVSFRRQYSEALSLLLAYQGPICIGGVPELEM